jgi:class 3 adenylate cyclase
MQPPPVQYATTRDAVRIAYTVSGSGPPLVFATEPVVSHVQLEWTSPVWARMLPRLAERLTLVRFDVRGAGLSDRAQGSQPLLAGATLDLEAVVDRLGLTSFALAAVQTSAMDVIAYTHDHAGSVTCLVLMDGIIRGADLFATSQGQALMAAITADYTLGTEAIGAAAFGVGRDENRDYGAYIRACVDRDFFARGGEFAGLDVSELLDSIEQPTLVLKHAGLLYVPLETAKELAARIPNAQLVVVDGAWADGLEELADRIVAFALGAESQAEAPAAAQVAGAPAGVRAILFTDIEGHTAMMQRLGDALGRGLLREHERITREMLRSHGGVEIKAGGDGFMVSFGSVVAAAECAIALQRAFAAHTAAGGEALHVRIGISAGEPIAEDNDLFGSSVIMAARLQALACGDEVLVSAVVRDLAAGKGFLFSDRGETPLRGFEDPVRVYELRWRE